MSQIEQDIITAADITLAYDFPIESLDKIKQVMVSYKIQKKEFTPLALRKLLRRYQGEPTEEELIKLHNEAELAFMTLKTQKEAEVANMNLQTLDYQKVADVIRKRYNTISYLGVVYRYVDGIYIADKEGLIDSAIVAELCKIDDFDADADISRAAHQVKHYLRFEKVEPENPWNQTKGAFNVANGIVLVDMETGEHKLIPHSPDYKFNYKLKVEYDADAPVDEILQYIESLGSEIKDLLVQIPCHCLLSMDGRVYKKAYFLMGAPDSGKSTYIEMVATRFFGSSVVSSMSLQELLYDKFKRANLEGKLMNYRGDLSTQKIADTGTFKLLTGGDGISIERKCVQSEENFVNRAVFVFSANRYPKITLEDDDGAFWGRWIPIPMKNVFPKDPTFPDRVFTPRNMSGLLNLVLMTMPNIIRDGLRNNGSIMQDWINDSDSSHEYISKTIGRCDGAVLIKGSVYQDYTRYCNENDLASVDIRVFTKSMRAAGYRVDSKHKVGGRYEHCYTDCKLISEPFGTFPDGYKAAESAGTVATPAAQTNIT